MAAASAAATAANLIVICVVIFVTISSLYQYLICYRPHLIERDCLS